jgi:hypothetical protein
MVSGPADLESGREMAGHVIDEGVRRRIESSDALIAFFTRVTPTENGRFKPANWVVQEYTHAAARGLFVLQVREPMWNLPANWRETASG